MEVDVRYFVAAKRYEVTREIRVILRNHFEDAFQSPQQVYDAAKQLNRLAEQTSAAIKVLLELSTPLLCRLSPVSSSGTRAEGSEIESKGFGRIWKLDSDGNHPEVVNFSAWSAILLHLMVHKAFCVLYHPIFKDTAIAFGIKLRARFDSVHTSTCIKN
jgi:hypothetical protein